MFKQLFRAWTGKDLLSQAFDNFNAMLETAERLFDRVTDVLLCKPEAELRSEDLCNQDDRINELEHEVREKIVEYLTFEPQGNMPAALLLFSIVKDAERLGDFCKDIMDIAAHFPRDKSLGGYAGVFLQMEAQLEEMFSKARNSFLKSDETLARDVVKTRETVKGKCRELLARVMADDRLNSETAASYALAIYFFKRVAAHLLNIASSVLVPVVKIGHYRPPEA
jgi:phosphate transport system protein